MTSIRGLSAAFLLWTLTGFEADAQVVRQAPATDAQKAAAVPDPAAGRIKAVNYRVRGGPTRIDFKGTSLLPSGEGEAWIENKEGYVQISAKVDKLMPASSYGPEFLTYVLWAITPEGRAANLGEFVLNGKNDHKSKIEVTTDLQSFGMIVTAEPYFAVVRPSDAVVLENVVRKDTKGAIQEVDVVFDLEKRDQYAAQLGSVPAPVELEGVPLDLAQARNAVRIATGAGAGTFAADTLNRANTLLLQAETEHVAGSSKSASTFAREAVQTAEDARLVSIRGLAELRFFIERQVLLEREEALKMRVLEEFARIDTEVKSREARAQAKITRLENERNVLAEQADTQRMKAEAADREADTARSEARRSEEEYRRAEEAKLAAERERNALRANLRKQLGLILETRDTARGLIVTLADVHFDTAQYTLKERYRETLARIAGILLMQPGLTIEVEGFTDNVGATDYNQQLSERRAASVRDFFISQGVPQAQITARGFGESQPIASNESGKGRAENRRVNLIVSGDAIGAASEEAIP